MYKGEKVSLPRDISLEIKETGEDNTSGAAELTRKAAETFIHLIDCVEVSSRSQYMVYIESAAQKLVQAQPAMAPIFNLCNGILLSIDELETVRDIQQRVREYSKDFIQKLNQSEDRIAELTKKLISNHTTILTHSYSSTVLKSLLLAKSSDKEFTVICTESRPMREGVNLAKKLGEKGITVKLIVDSAMFSFLKEVDMVFVGGDAVLSKGLINKIGTCGLAAVAKQLQVNIFALSSLAKFLSPEYSPRFKTRKDPGEIEFEKMKNVTPINYYFDLTPLKYLTGVVTENGVMESSDITVYLHGLKVHRVFSS
jgi:translation initiation factor 2B subunit (eIF-2B alpha/beta/delta family)